MWDSLVDKGIGGALSPWNEKRVGIARNEVRKHEIIMLAEAEIQARNIRRNPNLISSQYLDSSTKTKSEVCKIEPSLNMSELLSINLANEKHEALRKERNVSHAIIIAE
ncbi:membrane-fusion protein [Aliivibrio fischeri MJ11]|uniref:Membrane-fusion protein n=2 Tax=Aliivibrio fischeri TaxID=668 RepID=B5EU57_ALIFM|nr:membrane-fusion protein [Aliivibrio fischeri MJ11]